MYCMKNYFRRMSIKLFWEQAMLIVDIGWSIKGDWQIIPPYYFSHPSLFPPSSLSSLNTTFKKEGERGAGVYSQLQSLLLQLELWSRVCRGSVGFFLSLTNNR